MKPFFKPEDFNVIEFVNHDDIAAVANQLIQQRGVRVYGYGETPMASSLWNMNGPEKERAPHTHSALLVCIEELPKRECKHVVDLFKLEHCSHLACLSCGIPLRVVPER